jgi:16S rRNA (uracil1498-N3)-methyltransferase
MRIPRIYQSATFCTGKELVLTEAAAHHLVHVLRLPIGAAVRLFNGEGGEFAGIIRHIKKTNVIVEVGEYFACEIESPLRIHLGQGIARGEKMDWIIQKSVELGVTCITPLMTERCNIKLEKNRVEKRLQHWQTVAIAACEQAGRIQVPTVLPIQAFNEWIVTTKAQSKFILDPQAKQSLLEGTNLLTNVCLAIGPEGGLAENEINLAKQQGFVNLRLGPRILRTETAALAAIAVLQYGFGDLK